MYTYKDLFMASDTERYVKDLPSYIQEIYRKASSAEYLLSEDSLADERQIVYEILEVFNRRAAERLGGAKLESYLRAQGRSVAQRGSVA